MGIILGIFVSTALLIFIFYVVFTILHGAYINIRHTFKKFGFSAGNPIDIEHIDLDKIEINKPYLPYTKKPYLMTRAEFNFFKILQEAVNDRFYIIPQVALAKIISVNRYEHYYKTYLNKIDRKSVDFVLFDKGSFSPMLIIELDDGSHSRFDRIDRDKFVDAIALEVGISITHIRTAHSYDINEIRSFVNSIN